MALPHDVAYWPHERYTILTANACESAFPMAAKTPCDRRQGGGVIREPYYIQKTTTNHGSENSFKEDFMKNNMYQRGKMTMVK